jgi:hypothetical protein
MGAVLAPSLINLRAEIARQWPHRDRTHDGWIGDPAHQATGSPEHGGSDHNPNMRDRVDAIDVDINGIVVPVVIASAMLHPATHYVIHDRRIYDRTLDQGRPHAYLGSNPHTDHIHISIRQAVDAELDSSRWRIIDTGWIGADLPWAAAITEDTHHDQGNEARELQTLLNAHGASLQVDGYVGPLTMAAVHGFINRRGLNVPAYLPSGTPQRLYLLSLRPYFLTTP